MQSGISRLVSPFARFNLWRNPFGELARDERAELAVVEVGRWIQLLARPTTALQFLGDCGQGKTTHLLAMARELPTAHYVYLPEDGPRPRLPADRPLLIDEAQRLGPRQRRLVLRQGGPLVLATHIDLTRCLARWRFSVVSCDVGANRSLQQLARILNRRIEASRLTAAELPRVDLCQTRQLQLRFGANLRAIESHLYQQLQQAAEKGLPWPLAN